MLRPAEVASTTASASAESVASARSSISRMEAFHAREGERAACLTFCRDTITRLAADAGAETLQKAQVETIMADRVRQRETRVYVVVPFCQGI